MGDDGEYYDYYEGGNHEGEYGNEGGYEAEGNKRGYEAKEYNRGYEAGYDDDYEAGYGDGYVAEGYNEVVVPTIFPAHPGMNYDEEYKYKESHDVAPKYNSGYEKCPRYGHGHESAPEQVRGDDSGSYSNPMGASHNPTQPDDCRTREEFAEDYGYDEDFLEKFNESGRSKKKMPMFGGPDGYEYDYAYIPPKQKQNETASENRSSSKSSKSKTRDQGPKVRGQRSESKASACSSIRSLNSVAKDHKQTPALAVPAFFFDDYNNSGTTATWARSDSASTSTYKSRTDVAQNTVSFSNYNTSSSSTMNSNTSHASAYHYSQGSSSTASNYRRYP